MKFFNVSLVPGIFKLYLVISFTDESIWQENQNLTQTLYLILHPSKKELLLFYYILFPVDKYTLHILKYLSIQCCEKL